MSSAQVSSVSSKKTRKIHRDWACASREAFILNHTTLPPKVLLASSGINVLTAIDASGFSIAHLKIDGTILPHKPGGTAVLQVVWHFRGLCRLVSEMA
eukprot:46266-Amphidinium_carterae.1